MMELTPTADQKEHDRQEREKNTNAGKVSYFVPHRACLVCKALLNHSAIQLF